jgi:putative phage-type endonuclease
MAMIQHQLIQGSAEWHAHRATHFNASDAPAMLGLSSYKSRDQLLHELATGFRPEVDAATQKRFDDGHKYEHLARPLAETIIGEELYPVVGTLGNLSASFDGITLLDDVAFEHKSLNDTLRACMTPDATGSDLPEMYQVQMEQQCMVSGAERVLFMASKWTDTGELIEERHCWYAANPKLAEHIKKGWAQFELDLGTYQAKEQKADVVGVRPDALPALYVEVAGQLVTQSNLAEFRAGAERLIGSIKTELVTDQDFADAEAAVKWLADAEKKIDAAVESAMSRTGPLEELVRTLKDVQQNLMRTTRLSLNKQVEAQKVNRRNQIVAEADAKFSKFLAGVNGEFAAAKVAIGSAAVKPDFNLAIKGKRSFDMMVSACNDAEAAAKIQVSEIAAGIRHNLALLAQHADHDFLFSDKQRLVMMGPDHLALTIKSKIDEYTVQQQAQEAARVQRHKNTIQGIEAASEFGDDMPYSALVSTRNRIAAIDISKTEEFAIKADAAKAATLVKIEARIAELQEAQRREKEAAAQAERDAAPAPAPAAQPVKATPPPSAPIATAPTVAQTTKASAPVRPTNAEMVGILAQHYHQGESVVTGWLREFNRYEVVEAA